MGRLTGYPLLFAVCSTLTFSISLVSTRALEVHCGPWDLVGRYATPLLIAVPFFIAAIFTAFSAYWQERGNRQTQEGDDLEPTVRPLPSRSVARSPLTIVVLEGLLILLVAYLGLQSYTYFTANAGYTFQTSACVMAPANNDLVIDYMQREHLRYAWSHGWMGDPIAFKTNSAIITADSRFLTGSLPYLGRLPAFTLAGGDVSSNRFTTILQVQSFYNTCIAPRIIGGSLPSEPYVPYADPHLLPFGLVVGVFCLFASIAAIGLSLFWHSPILLDMRRLTGYPLLFAVCSTLTFSISLVSTRALEVHCGPWDLVGR